MSAAHPSIPMPRKDLGGTHAQPESHFRVLCYELTESDPEFKDVCFYGTFNGALLHGGGFAGNKMKAEGCTPGFPDSLIFNRGTDGSVGLAIEFKVEYEYEYKGKIKRKKNKLSDDQEAWFAKLRGFGWRCEVVYTVEQFKQIVRSHIGTTHGGGESSTAGAVSPAAPTTIKKRRRCGRITSCVEPIDEDETPKKTAVEHYDLRSEYESD